MKGRDLALEDWYVSARDAVVRPPAGRERPMALPERVPASVPGCVHTDLLAAGLIGDPLVAAGEEELAWIGYCDWEYTTRIDWHAVPDERVVLACDGLDTVADVTLNGISLARTVNMHRSYRFDVTEVLRPGANELSIRFASAIRYAEAAEAAYGSLPVDYAHPYNFIRKMACNFGWDWGPTLVTCGIWQGIRLERSSGAQLSEASVRAELIGVDEGLLVVDLEWDALVGPGVVVAVEVAGVRAEFEVDPGASSLTANVAAGKVHQWWPRGLGDQSRYDVVVTVRFDDGSGAVPPQARTIATRTWRVGFRRVSIDTTPDSLGVPFTVRVNDRPLFVRGVNWIPDDVFVSRIESSRLATRLAQVTGANMNLIRVWGGGLYGSDDLYDLCDELGVLVWQDFPFACAGYPESEAFGREIEAEAEQNVRRIGAHPSIAVWNGSNENLWAWYDWGWPERTNGRGWGSIYYDTVLPEIVAWLAPGVPYVPSSPSSSEPAVHPNYEGDGTTHLWDPWNRLDYAHYRDSVPRFVSEYGFQGPATLPTLETAIPAADLDRSSPALARHQKQAGGMAKLDRNLAEHFPVPEDFELWHFATSVNQARALAFAIEHLRSWSDRCSGSIIWQLNDCWPALSWSLIDSAGLPKPAWFAVRDSYADRIFTIQPREAGLSVVFVNDTDAGWEAHATVELRALDGVVRRSADVATNVPARSVRTIVIPPHVRSPGDRRAEILAVTCEGIRRLHTFVPGDALRIPEAELDRTVVPREGGGYLVQVVARSFLSELTLLVERVDVTAQVDTALVTLFPGERHTFAVDCSPLGDPAALLRPGVLRTANEVFHDVGSD